MRGKGEGDRAERVKAPSIGRRAVEAALDLSTERGMRRATHQVGSFTARTALLRRDPPPSPLVLSGHAASLTPY